MEIKRESAESTIKTEYDIYLDNQIKINDFVINKKIFDEEKSNYKIIDRETEIDNLINWISECKNSDKELMKSDLKDLINRTDKFCFSSISSNEYIFKGDEGFNEICEEILELNNKLI